MFGIHTKTLDHRGEHGNRSRIDSFGLVGWAAIAVFAAVGAAVINEQSGDEIVPPSSVMITDLRSGNADRPTAGGAAVDTAPVEAMGMRPSWLRIAN